MCTESTSAKSPEPVVTAVDWDRFVAVPTCFLPLGCAQMHLPIGNCFILCQRGLPPLPWCIRDPGAGHLGWARGAPSRALLAKVLSSCLCTTLAIWVRPPVWQQRRPALTKLLLLASPLISRACLLRNVHVGAVLSDPSLV